MALEVYETGLILTVIRWIEMSRKKHAWPEEADGIPQAFGVLNEEIRELRKAVDRSHPDEHVVFELLDVITVAIRMLCGEHLRGDKKQKWLDLVISAEPTQPGEIGPYDEHKGEK